MLVAREGTQRRDQGSLGLIGISEGRRGLPAWSARKKGCCPVSAAVHRITAKRSRLDRWHESEKKKRIKAIDLDSLRPRQFQSVSLFLLEKVGTKDNKGSGLFVACAFVRLSWRRRPTGVPDIATARHAPPMPENAEEDRPGCCFSFWLQRSSDA